MIALVGAMFVALQSVSAAACAANPNISLDIGASCEVNHDDAVGAVSSKPAVATVEAANPATNGYTIKAVTPGSTTVTLLSDLGDDEAVGGTGDNADTALVDFGVNVNGFGIAKLEVVDDPDGVVSAGEPIKVRATLRSGAPAATVRLTVPTTGLSIALDSGNTSQTHNVGATVVNFTATPPVTAATADFMVNTAGAPVGEYVLTFTASNDASFTTTPTAPANGTQGTDQANQQVTDTLTVTVGEPGTGLSSATLSLGDSEVDIPYTPDDETIPETGTAAANGGEINVVIEAFDSLGGKSSTGAINQLTVFAHGGTITTTHNTGDGSVEEPAKATGMNSVTLNEVEFGTGAAVVGNVGQKTVITVAKTDKKPGTVNVRAFLAGPGGGAQTEELTLIFAGASASLSIHDASESLLSANPADADDDTIKLQVTSTDASGNEVDPPTSGVAITITDPEGKRVQTTAVAYTQPTKSKGKFYITLTGKGTAASPLAAGNYTLTAKSGKLEASGAFAVAGASANIELDVSADPDPVALGSVVSITATVTDKDGNTVADNTEVDFGTGGALELTDVGTVTDVKTKNGVAKARFIVSKGSGLGVIIVDSGAASATTSVSIAAAEAMPEEAMGLSCLSTYNAFSTYTCAQDSSASELFGLVSGRGATAIHLWNGTAWVRYSVVEGAMVPGSTDFPVSANETLYISY